VKEVTIYYSDDGKCFWEKECCLAHEKKLNKWLEQADEIEIKKFYERQYFLNPV
jgi:hypothetical protein